MIRDPSDGSVREKAVDENGIKSAAANQKANDASDLIMSTTSGLPLASTESKDLAKLEKSREWLKDYFQRKPEQGI